MNSSGERELLLGAQSSFFFSLCCSGTVPSAHREHESFVARLFRVPAVQAMSSSRPMMKWRGPPDDPRAGARSRRERGGACVISHMTSRYTRKKHGPAGLGSEQQQRWHVRASFVLRLFAPRPPREGDAPTLCLPICWPCPYNASARGP